MVLSRKRVDDNMIEDFYLNEFNHSVAGSTYFWNSELIITLLTIIAFCEVLQLVMKLGGYVLK